MYPMAVTDMGLFVCLGERDSTEGKRLRGLGVGISALSQLHGMTSESRNLFPREKDLSTVKDVENTAAPAQIPFTVKCTRIEVFCIWKGPPTCL